MARGKKQQADTGPQEIRRGSFFAKLYPATHQVDGRPYDYFWLTYHTPDGLRKVRDFKDRAAAVKEAEEVAKSFTLGRPEALSWSPKERPEFDAAAQALDGRGAEWEDLATAVLFGRRPALHLLRDSGVGRAVIRGGCSGSLNDG